MGSAALVQAFVETLVSRAQTPSCLDICGADIMDHGINLFYKKRSRSNAILSVTLFIH